MLELATRDRALGAVLEFLGLPTSFRTLYAALETIRNDYRTGGDESVRTWAGVSNARLELFEHTANSYDALGTDARHGITGKKGPAKPMNLQEAAEIVHRVVDSWIEQLLWLDAK